MRFNNEHITIPFSTQNVGLLCAIALLPKFRHHTKDWLKSDNLNYDARLNFSLLQNLGLFGPTEYFQSLDGKTIQKTMMCSCNRVAKDFKSLSIPSIIMSSLPSGIPTD